MNDVVVGIDRSETASKALAKAAAIASARRTNLHIVMCVERKALVEFQVGSDHFHVDVLSQAGQFLAEAAHRSGADGQVTTAVGLGDPAGFLCEEAGRLGASVIVVGNRRVQSLTRVLGTVAADVVKQAPCDVLVANTCGGPS